VPVTWNKLTELNLKLYSFKLSSVNLFQVTGTPLADLDLDSALLKKSAIKIPLMIGWNFHDATTFSTYE
jgi:hypothetical protein